MRKHLGIVGFSLFISACGSVSTMQPLGQSALYQGISVSHELPEVLPKGMSRFENSPFVFVHEDRVSSLALDMVVPLPFVTDMVVNSVNRSAAMKGNQHYLEVETSKYFEESLKKLPGYRAEGGAYSVSMLLPLEECVDDVHRVSILMQVEDDDWMGRYYYHLPTPIPHEDFLEPTESEIAIMEEEIRVGIEELVSIIARDIGGEFQHSIAQAKAGSLYIVGGRVAGLVNPTTYVFNHVEVLSQNDDSLILRIPGQMKGEANAGGMAFGVHHFTPDQLHTFEVAVN